MSNEDEEIIKDAAKAIRSLTNELRAFIPSLSAALTSALSTGMVTRCDLNAAEARITASIIGQADGVEALTALVVRAQKISSKLKVLSGKFTQLDSTTDSNKTAP